MDFGGVAFSVESVIHLSPSFFIVSHSLWQFPLEMLTLLMCESESDNTRQHMRTGETKKEERERGRECGCECEGGNRIQ